MAEQALRLCRDNEIGSEIRTFNFDMRSGPCRLLLLKGECEWM